jgi:hypothetical protein
MSDPFRILIAVHRPRYRGRTERAAAVPGWEVVSLLNKQDPVGQVVKGGKPPDIVVLSSDFGRQKSFGIFKAIQRHRTSGMKIVGLSPDCEEDVTGIRPADLCDICIPPPYKTIELRAHFCRLYEEIHGEPAPNAPVAASDEEDA